MSHKGLSTGAMLKGIETDNQSEINNQCENILSQKIYTRLNAADGAEEVSICERCYKSENLTPSLLSNLIENHFLRQYLSRFKFLCILAPCNFVGVLNDYIQHTLTCKFKPLCCIFDKIEFKTAKELTEHLLEHSNVKKVDFSSRSIKFNLSVKDISNKVEIILADYKENYFLVYIEKDKFGASFRIGHHLFDHSVPTINTFTIFQENEDTRIQQRGKIESLQEILNAPGNKNAVKLNTSIDNGGKISIYFMDYATIDQMKLCDDCPICFEHLNKEVSQCPNGHKVCNTCAPKITTCPICREAMPTTIKPNTEFVQECQNVDRGCLEMGNTGHNENCLFRNILCPECKRNIIAHTFYSHFVKIHNAQANFTVISKEFAYEKNTKIFIEYRSSIFCVEAYLDNMHNLKFCVKLMNDNAVSSVKYQFKIKLFLNNDAIAEVGTKCDGSSVSISLASYILHSDSAISNHNVYSSNVLDVTCQYNIFLQIDDETET